MDRKDQQRPTNSLAPQPVIVAIGPVSLLHRLDAHPGMHLVLSLHWHLGLRGWDLDVKVGNMEIWYAMVTIAVILGISRKRVIRLG